MECPSCHFVATPGQSAVEGTCPNCERPYRDQPTPLNSDMEMRNMPEPGMEDSGGNPLQEGILGDYQNRGVRDEAFASVKKSVEVPDYPPVPESPEVEGNGQNWNCPNCGDELHRQFNTEQGIQADVCHNCRAIWTKPMGGGRSDLMEDNFANRPAVEHPLGPHTGAEEEPEFEVTQVIVPDPDSIRPDKEQMAKQADFLDDVGGAISDAAPVVAPIAGGIVGGAVGSIFPGPGTAIGAALGAGLAGGGVEAVQGGDVGDVATTGLTDAALGGIGGGMAGAAGKAAGKLGMGAAMGSVAPGEAAAAGATRGGIGSLMKSAWSKVPTDKIKNAYLMHSVMGDAGGATQQMTTPTPGMLQPGQQQMSPSFYSAVETPTSHGEIPSNDTSDPEEVDYHEKNDGEKDGLQADTGTGDFGGADLGPDNFFSPDSGALSSFAELLPKILEYALGDQSAAGDPDMEELHQKLEAEKPGYMNTADDDHGSKIVMMIMKGNPGEEDGDSALEDNDAPHDPIAEHEASALRPGLETTCPVCGSIMDASTGNCPQCGMGNARHMPQPTNPDFTTPQQMMSPPMEATAAGATTQGPNTDEQKAQVAEVLQAEGRAEEISAMIMEPWNYADELSKITGQEEPPQDIGQPDPPPPIPPGGQEGAMPVPGMTPPGPQTGPSMMAAVRKYAASVDGFCEHCPECGSHSTGYLDYEEGKAGCKTCGHKFNAPKMVEHSSAGEDLHAAPEAPELGQPEPEEAQDEHGSLGWVDESGAPLSVGQTYDMFSNNYDIPDRVTIDAVKPDVIEFTLVGEYGLSHHTELTHEEASVEGTNFVPTEGEAEFDQAPEEAGQGAQPVPGPGDQTDLSTPHEMMTAKTSDFRMGSAPPMDSHEIALTEAEAVEGGYNSEVAQFFDDPVPQAHEASVESEGDKGPAWLMEGVPLTSHMAGAQMTPWEQRDYIDETGDARNADKLQLGGTHYEMDDLNDSFLFGI